MEYIGTFTAYSKTTGDFLWGGYILKDGTLVDNDGSPCGVLPFIHYENKTSNNPNTNITEKKAKSTDTIKETKTATPMIVFFATT